MRIKWRQCVICLPEDYEMVVYQYEAYGWEVSYHIYADWGIRLVPMTYVV